MKRARLCLYLLLGFALSAAADNWPMFRGPNQSARGDAPGLPAAFTEADLRWKVKTPLPGHGSPVVWGTKLFVMGGDDRTADRGLFCYDTDSGKLLWRRTFASTPYRLHKMNNHGTCTPAVDAERVYIYWASDEQTFLAALDHTGDEIWRRELGPFVSSHGGGTSPMRWKDLVIVTHDQAARNRSHVTAYEAATGAPRWKIPRASAANGSAYAVPLVIPGPDGSEQLILASSAEGVIAVNPTDGKRLWRAVDRLEYRVVASPAYGDGVLVVSSGKGGGGRELLAIAPGSADGKIPPRVLYEKKRSIPYVCSPLIVGDRLFLIQDGLGLFSCLALKSGEEIWSERLKDSRIF